VALDIAFQCSPDHPYVREHPEWFRHRPDGTIQYAENPPKKYQDIYPFDFECDAWESLWDELLSVVRFWMEHGVRTFRVDNPHTKSLRFWEWCIAKVKDDDPDVVFLSEAFTRPKVMYDLAKRGFTQSYTYFAWRQQPWELEAYFRELTQPPVVDFFRPNAWPNTPDILTEQLQYGGRSVFVQRLVLAATLCANYGIYGPAFELMEHVAREPGSEEYLDSEKYQLRTWDVGREDSLRELIARVNRIRRENPALQTDRHLTFHAVDNPQLMAYSKRDDEGRNTVLTTCAICAIKRVMKSSLSGISRLLWHIGVRCGRATTTAHRHMHDHLDIEAMKRVHQQQPAVYNDLWDLACNSLGCPRGSRAVSSASYRWTSPLPCSITWLSGTTGSAAANWRFCTVPTHPSKWPSATCASICTGPRNGPGLKASKSKSSGCAI
jgi:hypothetical protein